MGFAVSDSDSARADDKIVWYLLNFAGCELYSYFGNFGIFATGPRDPARSDKCMSHDIVHYPADSNMNRTLVQVYTGRDE
jgi:hypothetical protein